MVGMSNDIINDSYKNRKKEKKKRNISCWFLIRKFFKNSFRTSHPINCIIMGNV